MEFENYEWYKTGNVAVRHGSREIVGTDTDWLKAGIKSGDILVLDNQIHEISEVTASTNLILVNEYKGENAGGKDYAIIPRAGSVLQSEIAQNLKAVLVNWNEREAVYEKLFTALAGVNQQLLKLGLGIELEEIPAQSLAALPIATRTQLGGVKIGRNIGVTEDGTISADVDKQTLQSSLEEVAASPSDMNEMLNEVLGS